MVDPTGCRHDIITAFFEDGDPDRHGRMWACADCWRRLYPACETCVDVGHRGETHTDRESEARQQEREALAERIDGLDGFTLGMGTVYVPLPAVLAILRDPRETGG